MEARAGQTKVGGSSPHISIQPTSNPHPFKLRNSNYSECLLTTKGHYTPRRVQHAASSEQRIFKLDILETRLCSALVGLLEARHHSVRLS